MPRKIAHHQNTHGQPWLFALKPAATGASRAYLMSVTLIRVVNIGNFGTYARIDKEEINRVHGTSLVEKENIGDL